MRSPCAADVTDMVVTVRRPAGEQQTKVHSAARVRGVANTGSSTSAQGGDGGCSEVDGRLVDCGRSATRAGGR
ncbi:MAG: hypothetical protein M0Z87_06010 [Actinomycetota bacterium]|nr:hypothetical protein [Actinomycetota bacterium]